MTEVAPAAHRSQASSGRKLRATPGAATRFLHLVPDNKFIDDAHALFEEALPGGHDYAVLAHSSNHRLIKTFEPRRIGSRVAAKGLLEELSNYRAIFVHFLNDPTRLFIDQAPASVRLVWIGWGADYYHLIRNRNELVLPGTRELIDSIAPASPPSTPIWQAMRSALEAATRPAQAMRHRRYRRRLDRIGPGRPDELQFLNRFELFAPVLEEEFGDIRSAHPEFRPELVRWNYWSSGLDLLEGDSVITARNILLGNSATPENNHVEAMRLIPADRLQGRKILCPLSYGNSAYGDLVDAFGSRLYGEVFVPLRTYLGTGPYVDALRSCSIAAMNHVRQQGLGNIIMMLWNGARIFLNHESPIASELASLGIKTFDIRDLPDHLTLPEPEENPDRLADTRERLRSRFGRDTILGMTVRLLDRAGRDARNNR